ncbi:hypothetical protein [Clostridium gasigenes]|uniref:hypothetical protein n=1 Tax=Clostridium gasigenes TaxID=94869 RepID=UPI001C0A9AF5|nr:hypothetical protein [Clostridium gasigenes]MBU3107161.1 hypothetical protein [Clostridium gasigenes]
MSKFNIKLSYKNCCILKHALRDKIVKKEELLEKLKTNKETKNECLYYLNELGYTEEQANNTLKEFDKEYDKLSKGLDEEKRALAVITEEMIKASYKHGRAWYKPSNK